MKADHAPSEQEPLATADPEAPRGSLAGETKRFGLSALTYLLPNLLVRGITFLLTPVYTRFMTPEDFGVVSVANAIVAVLGMFLGLALYGCVPRLFFEYDERERRTFFGSLLAFSMTFPAAVVAVLWVLGAHGMLRFFPNVPFDPYLKLVLLTAFVAIFPSLPTSIYMAREEPRKVAIFSFLSAIAQLGLTIVFVAIGHQGAIGVLRANLASGVIVGALAIVLMLRMSTVRLAMPGIGRALAFSIPLVPHLMANWALSISDRLVLDRYVAPADLGRYSLAYVFSLIMSLIGSSVGNALGPMANRQLKSEADAPNVPPLGTYAMLINVVAALGIVLTAPEILAIIAPPAYAGAAPMVPWVVLGAVMQSVYVVVSIGTWFSMRTKWIPAVTAIGAVVNIGINLVFVPRYGAIAAAVSTFIAYAITAILHGLLANALHPIRWEYGRWARLLGLGILCYGAARALPLMGIWGALVLKTALVLVVFPLALFASGFFSRSELGRIRSIVRARLGA